MGPVAAESGRGCSGGQVQMTRCHQRGSPGTQGGRFRPTCHPFTQLDFIGAVWDRSSTTPIWTSTHSGHCQECLWGPDKVSGDPSEPEELGSLVGVTKPLSLLVPPAQGLAHFLGSPASERPLACTHPHPFGPSADQSPSFSLALSRAPPSRKRFQSESRKQSTKPL